MDVGDDGGWYSELTHGETQTEVKLTKDVAYELNLDMHWVDPEVAKDFSVIAQGADGGEISITHWKGLKTASLPLIGGSTATVPNKPGASLS